VRYFSRRPVELEFILVWPPLRQCLAPVFTIVQQRLRPTLAFCQAPSRLRVAPAVQQCLGRQLAFCRAPVRLRRLRVDFALALSMSRFGFVPAPCLAVRLGLCGDGSLSPASELDAGGALGWCRCDVRDQLHPLSLYVSMPEGSTHPASVFSATAASLKGSMSSRNAGGLPGIVSTRTSCRLVAHHSETGPSHSGFSRVRVSGSEGEK
jgi:hypothetical protein